MLKLKSFTLDQLDEANDFIEKNPPRSTERQSGLIFHEDRLVVIYDDYRVNLLDKKNITYALYEKELQTLIVTEPKLEITKRELKAITPPEFEEGDSKNVLESKLRAKNMSKDDINYLINHLLAFQSNIVLNTATIEGCKENIAYYEELLTSFDENTAQVEKTPN